MFFIDKYKIDNPNDMLFNLDILKILKNMTSAENCESIPHVIFVGPNGSGVKTLIKMLLLLIYDFLY